MYALTVTQGVASSTLAVHPFMEEKKTCPKCGIEKLLLVDFQANRRKKDGRQSYCKDCGNKQSAAWYEANRERRLASVAGYREANQEALNAKARAYHHRRNEKIAQGLALPRVYDPEKNRESNRRWRAKNLERCRASDKARRDREGPEAGKARCAKRRALKRGYQGKHYTKQDVKDLLYSQKAMCAYCSVSIAGGYHIDHIVPLSRGGGNGKENICLACPSCNCRKHNKTPDEWSP